MLTEIQEKLLDMLGWFHNFCKENGITYYLVGGSMLGCVRHGGFIPWDDDIDVALPRPEYEKLLKISGGMKGKYVIESLYDNAKDYPYLYAKMYDTDTTLIEEGKYHCKRGIYLDIFPFDGLGNEKNYMKNFKKAYSLHMFYMTRICVPDKERSKLKNAAIVFSRLIPQFIVNDKKLAARVNKVAASNSYDESDYVANIMGTYKSREIVEKKMIGKTTEYKFENVTVYGVEHYDEFLTHIYGNWRELPPEEKRKTRHPYVLFDINKSYLDEEKK